RVGRPPRCDGAEIGRKPPLVVLAEALAAEQQHGVLVPGVLDLAQRFRIQRAAKIDAADFRPDHGMQPGNRNRPDPLSHNCHVSLPSPTIAPCNVSGRRARQPPLPALLRKRAQACRCCAATAMPANGMARPCSGPASKGSWQGAPKTRSTPCHTSLILESP